MPVSERLQTLGSWSLTLRPDTPRAVRDLVSTPFQHIIITPSWVEATGMSDAAMLDIAMYNGVVVRPGPQYELGGYGLAWWWGDDRGVPHLDQAVGGSQSQSLSTWISQIMNRVPSWSAGSVAGAGPVGGTAISYFRFESARQALDAITRYFQVEWRINNDYTLDYGTAADLYGSTPVATALTRGQGGREMNLSGFRVKDLDYSRDFSDFLTIVTAAGRGGTGTAFGVNPMTEYDAWGPFGTNITRRAFFDVPETALGLEVNYAESIVERYSDMDYVGISTDDMVRPTFGPGYLINVYDPDRGLVDADNQQIYQGEVVFPKEVRVIGMSWPIERGMGVYYRKHEAFPSNVSTYVDLTPYVEWEQPGTRIEVGNPAYSPIAEQFSTSSQTAPVKAGQWDEYTPSLTASTTNPTLGTSTITGHFRREGTTLHIRGELNVGSTFAAGSGEYRVSLPSGMSAVSDQEQQAMGQVVDANVGRYPLHATIDPASFVDRFRLFYSPTAAVISGVTNNAPATWASGDRLWWNGTIEVDP